ncbi:hypothetical protein JCM8115_002453 [Rhodotorula mucilaginosa]
MARRTSGSKVSYKELDSDGDDGMAPWGLSEGDDDADLKALKAAAPLAKKRKKAGAKRVGDTYRARRPQRKKPKKNKAPLPVETNEGCESDTAQKDPDDGNPVKRAVDDGSDESDSEQKAASNEPNAAATESTAAGGLTAPGFSGELLLQLPFEMFAEASAPMHSLPNEFRTLAPCMLFETTGSELLNVFEFPFSPDDSKWDDFLVSEVTEVNKTLVRLQTQDDAARAMLAKRSLWTTRSRRTEMQDEDSLRTDNVARYLSVRKSFLDRRVKESAQVEENHREIQCRKQAEVARIAKEAERQLKKRVKITVKQLRDNHGWTAEDTAKLQKGLTAYYVSHPYSLAPETLPNDDRAAWAAFQVKFQSQLEQEAEWEREDERYRQRQTLLKQTYATMTRSLEAELMFVPSWTDVAYERPVMTFLRAKPTPGEDEASHDPELLRATLLAAAKQHVQHERLEAIRGIVAAHLDIPTKQLSKKADDYPNDVYDEAFFRKIPNRFAVTSGRPRTFQQLQKQIDANARSLKIRGDLAEWRRATRHVLLAAGKEASPDLDEADALGASFTWQNGPEAIKAQRYTWNVMVETIVNKGPEGLGLSDLKDISVVYTPNKGKGKEKDLDASDDDVKPVRRKKIVGDSEDDSSSDDSDA